MQQHVTLLPPEPLSPYGAGISPPLPSDLLQQVRSRVRLLALLLLIGFAFDPAVFLLTWATAKLVGQQLPPEVIRYLPFLLADLAIAVLSVALWWLARRDSVSSSRLLTVGLVYQVVICFEIAVTMPWQWFIEKGSIPPLTWVPMVIVLFPLIMPGPPRRMLATAILAGATSPLGLLLLDVGGKAGVDLDDYVRAIASGAIAVVFASLGARVVYRLGREVSAARELGSSRLEERLGQGGMGEVWRARHRMLARPAAIKLIRPSALENGGGGASTEWHAGSSARPRSLPGSGRPTRWMSTISASPRTGRSTM